jgi:hypothetical protein
MSSGSAAEDKREQRLKLLEDHIGQHLRASESSGELKAATATRRRRPNCAWA